MTDRSLPHLTAIVLTKNEARHITDCLACLGFADHRLVFDSFSDDDTVALAAAAGAEVIQHPFANYTAQRNAALDAVRDRTAWVLFVDADERISPELAAEIQAVLAVADATAAGWRLPRHNYIFGTLTLGAGWYPDYQTRLLRVDAARYDSARKVHETVLLDGALGTLTHPIIHYNYDSLAQFYATQQRYTAYEAQVMFESGVRPKPQNYLLQPLRHFKWRFFTLKGYRDGWHGLRLSALMAWYEFRKYLMLRALWSQ